MISPFIHIVILNWNSYKDTVECLKSLAQLDYPSFRVWVVDNDSTNMEADRLREEFPWAFVKSLNENIGFCGGCNVGMKHALDAGADYIMLLNNDTLVTPGLLNDLLNGYKTLKDPGAVSPIIMHYPEKEKIWFSEAIWSYNMRTGEAGFRLTNGEDELSLIKRGPYPSEFACGCCLFVSANIIRQVGLFDERYFAYFDEAEWCARMARKGFKSYIIPSAKMYHKVGQSTPSLVMTYLMTRNGLLWVKENLSWVKKIRTWMVFCKTLTWHWLNTKGLIPDKKQSMSISYSKVVIQGYRDYIHGQFGKWKKEIEPLFTKP